LDRPLGLLLVVPEAGFPLLRLQLVAGLRFASNIKESLGAG
jgi:hypothetical protein